ncbi:MAG: glycosyltransferase family 4 protein [Spirochaetota bacterium]|nr:glycosyltransferase family 4 protein [Spirochaetota bacterium]
MFSRTGYGKKAWNDFSILIMASVRWYNASAHYALFLAEGLKKAGYNVFLFGIPESPIIISAKELGITTLDDIDLMDSNPISYIRKIDRFRSIVSERKINIINPHISRDHSFAYFSLIDKKIPLIRTKTDSTLPRNNLLNRFFYMHSARHYTISSSSMASALKSMGIDDKFISIIPLEMNYRDFSDYKPQKNLKLELNIPDNRIVISFIGRLDRIKGVDHFIKSYSFLKENNKNKFHYIVSGEEINLSTDYLMRIAKETKLDNISFIGRLSDVRDILSITDIGVIPSIGSETICRIALEMLSFGLPIIGSNVNSIPEVISDYEGIVIDPAKPNEIAKALETLSHNKNYIKKKTKIKSKIAHKNPQRFIIEYLEIYSKARDGM